VTFPDLPPWINRETTAMMALGVSVLGGVVMYIREAMRNPLFRWSDLFTADNGRIASAKAAQAGAFIGTAWFMYYLVVTGKAGALEVAAWGGMWIAGYAVNKKQNNDAVVEVAKVGLEGPPPIPKVSDKS